MSRGRKRCPGTTGHTHETSLPSIPAVISYFCQICSTRHTIIRNYLRALRDMFVIDVQEAKSRCLSLEQNLLRLVQVLQREGGGGEHTFEIRTHLRTEMLGKETRRPCNLTDHVSHAPPQKRSSDLTLEPSHLCCRNCMAALPVT